MGGRDKKKGWKTIIWYEVWCNKCGYVGRHLDQRAAEEIAWGHAHKYSGHKAKTKKTKEKVRVK